MSDLIERPIDAADPTYPDAERCAQTLEACEDDLLTEAQFVRWQGREIDRLTAENRHLRQTATGSVSAALHDAALAELRGEIERLRQWETCGQEWLGKTDWVQERVNAGSWPISALGKHRADVMRDEIERLTAERDELRRQLAEAEMDAERYRWLRNEANTARKCDPMVCIYPLDEQDLIDGDRLDVAIDAAMGGGDAG